VRNRSSALVLLPTLQPEIRGTEATELCAVWPVEPPGGVVVLTGGEVVGGVVAGGDVVGGGVVVAGVVVLPGLGEAVVVVTLPPGAALGTVVGLG
jgi:hypothetical protein